MEGAAIHNAAPDATLLGRERERARLEGVLDGARAGRSGALVLRGEPGIGKSALLDCAAERAGRMTVVRALGVESEAELEFSALLEVCRPLLHRLPLLPRRQADALSGALGIGMVEAVDRLAIGAATLGLLTAAAEQAPVLVLVDDAQWLDRSSADALLFAARRLEAERAIRISRDHGAYTTLHRALGAAAWHNRRLGRWQEAYAYASEALALARETGETTVVVHLLTRLASIDAYRGNELACRANAREAIELAAGLGLASEWLERALASLDRGLGRLEDAARRLEALESSIVERGYFDTSGDLVETYYRLGDRDRARETFDRRLAVGARLGGAEAGATEARCRGLLANEGEFEPHFRRALELHEGAEDTFGAARTRLTLGERLRRSGRRIDARRELRGALDAFEELGAQPWAERARAEPRAGGAKLRRREASEGEELTPQERQIALHVAEGKRNKEVAAALFLSHKTVDFHLRRIYRKLNVHSRGELIRHFASAA